MKLDKLKHFIQEGESETLEFKSSTANLQSAAKTLCALYNPIAHLVQAVSALSKLATNTGHTGQTPVKLYLKG